MKWLVPQPATFKQIYPDADVRLTSDVQFPDFGREDVDFAIHNGNGDYPGLE
mgnify:FL=1|tara:strand:- start:414 stop:569 length:156 start_codon:yes stop_codon:yes gene_type:complete